MRKWKHTPIHKKHNPTLKYLIPIRHPPFNMLPAVVHIPQLGIWLSQVIWLCKQLIIAFLWITSAGLPRDSELSCFQIQTELQHVWLRSSYLLPGGLGGGEMQLGKEENVKWRKLYKDRPSGRLKPIYKYIQICCVL